MVATVFPQIKILRCAHAKYVRLWRAHLQQTICEKSDHMCLKGQECIDNATHPYHKLILSGFYMQEAITNKEGKDKI